MNESPVRTIKDLMLENEALREDNDTLFETNEDLIKTISELKSEIIKVKAEILKQRKLINTLKRDNSKLTLERNDLIKELSQIPKRHIHQNGKRHICTTGETIESLAELEGFKVFEILDENSQFIGYTLQPEDPELDEFINAEIAAEQHEEKLVAAMGSYMGDD